MVPQHGKAVSGPGLTIQKCVFSFASNRRILVQPKNDGGTNAFLMSSIL